jgi:YydG family peptide modification radical SAM enzyme
VGTMGITIGAKCNARCAHCCFSCTPKSTEMLTDAQVLDLVEQALGDERTDTIGLSGGEALLREGLVFSVLDRASTVRQNVTLVTNGYWGQSEQKARKKLESLRDAGLHSFTISFDEFHAEYIPPARIKNILNANRDVGLAVRLNVAVTRSRQGDDLMRRLGTSILRTSVTKFPVLPVGMAANFDDSEIIRQFRASDDLRCPGFEPTFHFDGNVYPCCSPAVFESVLKLGSVEEVSLSEAQKKIERNVVFAIIRRLGFRWLLDACRRHEISIPETTSSVVDACDLCRQLFSDSTFLSLLPPVVEEAAERLGLGSGTARTPVRSGALTGREADL